MIILIEKIKKAIPAGISNRYSLSVILSLWALMAYAAIPTGYYNTASGSGATLKTQLYDIIKGHTERTYTQLWTDFQTTDAKANGKVWDMYSDIPNSTPPYEYTFISNQCGNYTGEGSCYNREHSFPKSWFNDATPMYSDLFHLYPTDGYVNGQRGNLPFGEVSSPDWTSQNGSKKGTNTYPGYTGDVFEPIDEYKGDFARTYFYMATRYENVIAGWEKFDANGDAVMNGTAFPAFETWFLNMLGEWHTADPVSAKETARNDAVYGIQGNRNPYIDHPEYVHRVWGVGSSVTTEPANYPTNFSARNIKLQWADATGATVPQHYLIRMSTTGFGAIAAPTDGTAYPNSATDRNVDYGVQQARFNNLSAGITYYFKLYSYTGSGATADYKTDGAVPQMSVTIP